MNTRKLSLALAIFAVAALFTVTANAQSKEAANRAIAKGRGGIGVDVLGMGNLLNGSGANIYVPILISPQFRLEPSLNFARTSEETTTDNTTTTDTTLGFGVGIGAFYNWSPGRHTAVYVGPRLGVQYSAQSNEVAAGSTTTTQDISRTNIHLGVGLGGEYFFAKAFSLGGEVQLNYVIVGEPTVETSGGNDNNNNGPETSESRIGTGSQVFVRWYFF